MIADAPAVEAEDEAEEGREATTGFNTVMVEAVDEMLAICMASPRIEIHLSCIVHRRILSGLDGKIPPPLAMQARLDPHSDFGTSFGTSR